MDYFFSLEFRNKFVNSAGNQPAFIEVRSKNINLGANPAIKIYRENTEEPDYVSFIAAPAGSVYDKKYRINFPYELNSDGWYLVKIRIDGQDVLVGRVLLDSVVLPGVYQAVYTTQENVLAVQIYNFAENTAHYEVSTDGGETFQREAPADPGQGWAQATYDVALLDSVFNVVYREDGGLLHNTINDFNLQLDPNAGPDPDPDPDPDPLDPDPEVETNVVLFNNIWFSRNPITYNAAAHPGWEAETNVRVRDDVRIEESEGNNNYLSSIQIDLPPGEDGLLTFQVRQAFRKMLNVVPPLANSSEIVELTDRIKNFKHFIATMVDDEVDPSEAYEESVVHRAMMGGLSKYAFKSLNFFYEYLPETRKFLTWAPDEKPVDRNQEDYLNYFNFNTLTTTIKLNIQAFYDDGTAQRQEITTIVSSGGKLYQIPAGPVNSGALTINSSKNLTKYRLYLTNQNDKLISEVRTYVIDLISSPNKRLLMILNSMGAYEVLRFDGQSQSGVDVEKDIIVKFLPHSYNALDGEHETNYSVIRNTTNQSTGFLPSEEWFDYMKDVLRTERAFDVTDGKRRPVIIEGGSYDLNEDQNYERFVRFNIVDAYDDESYTPLL